MKDRVGEVCTTNEGYKVRLVAYRSARDIDIQFESGLLLKSRAYKEFKNGEIKNPYHPSKFGRGFIGVGEYSRKTNRKAYERWNGILTRCYSEAYHKKQPTYIGCTIDESWLDFQNFAEWFEENYIDGFDLDKDILFKGNRVYSPSACCFVPQEVNKLFTKSNKTRGELPIGVRKERNKIKAEIRINNKSTPLGYFKTPEEAFQAYKKAKEKEIKEIANICKTLIPNSVYQALLNYKVEIDD